MSEFVDPLYPPNKLLPEKIKITQHDIDKTLKLQEQNAIQRHKVIDEEKAFTTKQRSYLRVLELHKALRIAEDEFTALYNKEKPKEEPKNKKEKSMVLRNGEWVELE